MPSSMVGYYKEEYYTLDCMECIYRYQIYFYCMEHYFNIDSGVQFTEMLSAQTVITGENLAYNCESHAIV